MKKSSLIMTLVCVLMTACSSTHRLAPVMDHDASANSGVAKTNSPISKAVKTADKAVDGPYYTVKKGDTLLHIALEYGLSYRDIVAWNNLSNPNDIKVDQVLRIAAPDAKSSVAPAASGAPASKDVKTFNVNMTPEIEVRPASSSANPVGTVKVGPRGNKQPYSEAAMVELQKPDPTIAPPSLTPKDKAPDAGASASASFSVNDEALTWVWPAEGKIVATFEEGKSKGIDIAGRVGQKVRAASAGKVMYAGSGIRGYGNLVILKHTNNLLSAYAHNKIIMVKEGQTIAKGQVIAEMGSSDADAVKLHFEIRQQGKPVDPSKFLPSAVPAASN